jgi:hypothetical protein
LPFSAIKSGIESGIIGILYIPLSYRYHRILLLLRQANATTARDCRYVGTGQEGDNREGLSLREKGQTKWYIRCVRQLQGIVGAV